MTNPRDTRRWKELRKRLVRDASVCAICRYPLLKGAPARTPYSPSVDHVVPLAFGGAPFDERNLRVTHYGCNSRLGAKQQRRRSRRW
jgi:5-methylcytosine-specific restriction endonuclease McrA